MPGTLVEVRSRFEGSWARGFELVEVVESRDGRSFRVRRRSDGSVLPALFSGGDVREERHKNDMWWI